MKSIFSDPLRNNKEGDRMNVFQKLSVFTDRTYQQQIVLPSYHDVQTEVFRKHYGNDFPSVTELTKHIQAIFINSHPLLELQRPYSHKIKQIGGITLKKKGKLLPEFEKVLSSSKKGVIIFSFGSIVKISEVPNPILEIFVEVFSSLTDYNIIWKFDEERPELFKNTKNIYPVKWLQQVELLNDKRVKLFISHTGLNSLLEAAYSGVPVLSIPLFLDQHYNAQVLERRGSSISLDKHKITIESLTSSILTVLNNSTFSENARILQKMLLNFPSKPEETFLSWLQYGTEFKHLEKHFFMESSNLNVFEYLCLDAVLVILGVLGGFMIVGILTIAKLFSLLGNSRKSKAD